MGSHTVRDDEGRIISHISCPNIYQYKGLIFEWHDYHGASVYNKDFKLRKNPDPGRKSWTIIEKWLRLPPSKKKRTLIHS